MKIVSPYRNIKQHARISVEPYHMNSDIMINMKGILRKKSEKRCNKNGYIDTIYKIINYSDGRMPSENLNGSAIYDVTFHCKLCLPVPGTIIIAHVRVINQELVVAINGPIMIFIPKENVDNMWDISDGYMNKNSNKRLITGDYIKTRIIDKRINKNDTQIKAIGELLDFATSEEIDKYFGSIIISENQSITESDIQSDTQSEKQPDIQSEIQSDTQSDKQSDTQSDTQTDSLYNQTDNKTDNYIDDSIQEENKSQKELDTETDSINKITEDSNFIIP